MVTFLFSHLRVDADVGGEVFNTEQASRKLRLSAFSPECERKFKTSGSILWLNLHAICLFTFSFLP